MATSVPKKQLIRAISREIPYEIIREHLGISDSSNLQNRLESFRKIDLENLLKSTPEGVQKLSQLELNYPFQTSRCVFLVKLTSINDREFNIQLQSKVEELLLNQTQELHFGEQKSIRAVYVDRPSQQLENLNILEVPVLYEERIEYNVADKTLDNYGEQVITYNLQKGFVWFIEGHSHALICCSGIAAARSIIQYGRDRLRLIWWVPDLTVQMYENLTKDSKAQSTTFKHFPPNMPTITLHAPNLSETSLYRDLQLGEDVEETSGFFRNSSGSLVGSFGVARKFARIWTPFKIERIALVATLTDFIRRVESELPIQMDSSLKQYIAYFDNHPIIIKKIQISGKAKINFLTLVESIISATRQGDQKSITPTEMFDILASQKELCLNCVAEFDCPNCGGGLARCPKCLVPYKITAETEIKLGCLNCHTEFTDISEYQCECREIIQIGSIENHIQIYPDSELLDAINEFILPMNEVQWDGSFFIDGMTVKLIRKRILTLPERIYLTELQQWRTMAKFHNRVIVEEESPTFIALLKHTKEKCRRNNQPPNREQCNECLNNAITRKDLITKNQLCLPRILGFAINKSFDGIHHGHEIADIKYDDQYNDRIVNIGIHLKSRHSSKSEGLGRSVHLIKALYTQALYSAYKSLTSSIDFDVIGISVPNTIKDDVIESIQSLLNKLGFSFLVLDESDWVKITQLVDEQLSFSETLKTID